MRSPALWLAITLAGCSFRVVPAEAVPDAPQIPFKKRIAIDPARVTGAQAAFPVWIALDDLDMKEHAGLGGADIYFTAVGGAPIPHEIQRWEKSRGRLEAWVRLDLADDVETVLELRYGDPRPAAAPDGPAVFSGAFASVWHLDDLLSVPEVADARNERPGVPQGGLGPGHQVTARLGGGLDFDGASARVELVNPLSGGGDHTISAWVSQRAATGCDSVITLGTPATNGARWLHSHFTAAVSAGFTGNDWPNLAALPNLQNAGWTLLHWTFQGATRLGRLYRDGAEITTHTFNAGINTVGIDGFLGYAPAAFSPGGAAPCALNGVLDEVRVATAERSAGWIATEYANQSAPLLFYRVGPEEPAP